MQNIVKYSPNRVMPPRDKDEQEELSSPIAGVGAGTGDVSAGEGAAVSGAPVVVAAEVDSADKSVEPGMGAAGAGVGAAEVVGDLVMAASDGVAGGDGGGECVAGVAGAARAGEACV